MASTHLQPLLQFGNLASHLGRCLPGEGPKVIGGADALLVHQIVVHQRLLGGEGRRRGRQGGRVGGKGQQGGRDSAGTLGSVHVRLMHRGAFDDDNNEDPW